MKRKSIIQLAILLALGLGVLMSLVTFDTALFHRTKEPTEISVIIREAESAGWSAARQGMEQAAADYGAELRFLTLSTANNAQEQRELLKREISGGADGIVLIPADPVFLEEDVREASGRVSIVTLESDMTGQGARAFVSVDNQALGEALGRAALNGSSEGGRVLIINSAPTSLGISQRLQAAVQVLEDAGRQVNICVPDGSGSLSRSLEQSLMVSRTDVVLTLEAPALEAAAQILRTWTSPPLIYGMGATGMIASYLEQGLINAIAARNEFSAGYLAVEAAVRTAEGQSYEKTAPLEFSMIRKENMYDSENQKLLFPVTR